MSYNYLPGSQVTTVDGGLAARRSPTAKKTLVLGTAGQGQADIAYQVVDRSLAAKDYGFDGTLIEAMEELAQSGCDNIYLYRIGTKPATLKGIGRVEIPSGQVDAQDHAIMKAKDANNVGFDITFGQRQPNVASIYQIYYNGTGGLRIFINGNLTYSNDTTNPVDTGDCTVSGTAVAGPALANTAAAPGDSDWVHSIPLSNALIASSTTTAGAGTDSYPAVVLFLGDSGLSLDPTSPDFDPCNLYEALARAYDVLETFPFQQVYPPNARFDVPNVAFYNSTLAAVTDLNNPANGMALGWLSTWYDANDNLVFHWAHKAVDSANNVAAIPVFASGKDRVTQGYHEVSFPYQLARFCAKQSENQGGCIGFMGFNGPANYSPQALQSWIGYLPTFDQSGNPATPGKGLCGQPYLIGTTSSKLNTYCVDVATQVYRSPGLFQTVSQSDPTQFGEYDEGVVVDKNGYKVDIGAYLHVVGDYSYISNGYNSLYKGNIAGITAGFCSALDEKSALTNKKLPGVTQLYQISLAQLNALTQAKVNMLRFKGDNVQPALLHDYTCSTNISDYIFLLRQRIKFLVISVLFSEADKYIGESSTDGLALSAMKTGLDKRLIDLQTRGYLKGYSYTIYTTDADRRLGRVFIDIMFRPADELVQVRASITAGQ